jgi:endonuclease/exonuclease/phosphatase family metal-dependent hydrolase
MERRRERSKLEIKVMTFNIHHGKGTDGKINLKRIAGVIRESDVDIIGLNEVDNQFSKRSDYINQAAWLAEYLQMNYVFGPSLSFKSKKKNGDSITVREYGNALLSKHPILSHQTHPFNYLRVIEGRSLLEASIKINKQMLKIYTSHLSLNSFLHTRQTNFILKRMIEAQERVIVFGDWNMKPKAKAWHKITEHFTDVWSVQQQEHGYTFPSMRPRARLDYIFVSNSFYIVDSEVVKKVPQASDHLPLIATLRL